MNTSTDKDVDTEDDDLTADEEAAQADPDAAFEDSELIAEAPRRSRLPLILSVTAAGLAVAALALSGWLLTTTHQQIRGLTEAGSQVELGGSVTANETEIRRLQGELDELAAAGDSARLALAAMEERMAQMAAADGTVAADVDTLERRLEQRMDLIDSLPARVASIERSMSTLRGISTGAEDAWLLSQAEYFLQVANAELELSRNPAVAEEALRMADQRLIEIDDPGLTDVRRQLSADLQSLEALDMPEIAGTAVTLASLSRIVDSLPIREQLLTRRPPTGDDAPADDAEPAGGTERALATLSDAFSGFISVRRTDEAARPLIAPEAVYFLRANLSLQLQAARLSLLTGEQALFEQSLDDAIAWLREYYDTESTPVRSALATMNEIRGSRIIGDLPDISASLRLLRQYIAFNAVDDGAEPAPENGPAQ